VTDQINILEAETVEDDPFQGKKRRITYQCDKCSHVYVRTFKAMPKVDPPCPNKTCIEHSELKSLQLQVANLTRMLEEGRGPAQIGQKTIVKAIDKTAEIVMEDGGYTNLQDHIRQGEAMAPKLPPPMQKAADSFFSGGAKALGTGETMRQKQMKALGARAIAGAYRNGAVSPNMVLPKERPPVVTTSNPGYSPKGRN
jgi:hypothetical protein